MAYHRPYSNLGWYLRLVELPVLACVGGPAVIQEYAAIKA